MRTNHIFLKKRAIFSYLLTIIFVIVFLYYLEKNRQILESLRSISLRYLVLIGLLVIPSKVVIGLKFKVMMDFFGARLKFREWFGLACISSMANYILPAKAGIATQAFYMKRIHNFDYTKFIVFLAVFAVFLFTLNSFSGLLLLIFYPAVKGKFFLGLFYIFSVTAAISLAAIILLPYLSRLKIRWRLISKIAEGISVMRKAHFVLPYLFIIQLFEVFFVGLRLFLSYRAIGVDIELVPALIVGLFASSSGILNITPANLGVRELAIAFSSLLVGESTAVGLTASLLDRTLGTTVTLIAGLIFMPILRGRGSGKIMNRVITSSEIKNWYNREYYSRESKRRPYDAYPVILDLLGVKETGRLLDVACGAGFLLRAASLRGLTAYGIDISEEAVKIAKEISPGSFIAVGNAEHVTFKDNMFDYVTCNGALEHFLDMDTSLKEMKRVAKKNGVFCIVVPNAKFIFWRMQGKGGTKQQDINERLLTLAQWKKLFAENGFDIVRIYKDRWFLKFASRTFFGFILRICAYIVWSFLPLRYDYQFIFILKNAEARLRTYAKEKRI